MVENSSQSSFDCRLELKKLKVFHLKFPPKQFRSLKGVNELSADSIVIQFGLGEIRAKPKLIKLNERLIQLKGISLTQFFLSHN